MVHRLLGQSRQQDHQQLHHSLTEKLQPPPPWLCPGLGSRRCSLPQSVSPGGRDPQEHLGLHRLRKLP
jgi:hypothetical protein